MTYYVNRRNNNLDLFGEEDFFTSLFSNFNKESKLLKTDILETQKDFVLLIDVPGFNKKDIKITLEDKYLTITAEKKKNEDEESVKYLRNERYYGTASRSFYVGDVEQKAIDAKIEDGVLSITLPKRNYKKVEENKYIDIH